MNDRQLNYSMKEAVELNLSYMPFIAGGGLFVPTPESFQLGERVVVDVKLPNKDENIIVEGNVVWITPSNALHHVLTGIGVQFSGAHKQKIREKIEENLTNNMEVGGYTYGITNP